MRLPAVLLAAALQCLPMVRVALPAVQSASNLFAIIFRWSAGFAAALGGVQAVSGASTVITTPLSQNATNGVTLNDRQIRLTSSPDLAGYWSAITTSPTSLPGGNSYTTNNKNPTLYYVLPSGLYLTNTSSTAFYIRGTPTVSGDYVIKLTAKENFSSGADRTTTTNITLHITGGANSAPVADPQNLSTAEDTSKPITLTGSDVDGNNLAYTVVSQPSHGSLSGTAPNVTYLPATNYNGPDSFTFKVNDGTVDSPTATISLTVTAVNDPPIANAQSVITDQNVAKSITLTGSDVDGNPLIYSIVSQPAHGSLSGTPPNMLYTPNSNYNGSDSFTFKVNDSTVDSSPATVTLTINAVAPSTPPVLAKPSITPGGLSLQASGTAGETWNVERSTVLGVGWTNIGTLQIGGTGTGQYSVTNLPIGSAFFRLSKSAN